MTQYRHGDVLLTRLGDAAESQHVGQYTVILAEGETTGHAHRVTGRDVSFADGLLDCPGGAELTHEEHGLVVLEPGSYEVRRQRVWSLRESWSPVRD